MIEPELQVPAAYPLRTARIWTPTELLWGAGFAVPVLLVYLLTLAGGVGWWDSGELLACAKTLSVAHRPGFPLYLLTGRVIYGFLADPRLVANAESAMAATCALLFVWRGLCLLSGGGAATKIWLAAGGWLLAFNPLFWRQAIRTEVYAPAYACLGAAFLLAAAAQRAPDPRTAVRRFLLSAYLLALSFCLHSAVAASLWLVVLTLFLWGDFRPSLKQWCWAGVCLVAGLSVYAYVPLRAGLAPYVWGQPDGLTGFLTYLTASDSYSVISQEATGTLLRAGELTDVLVSQSHWLFVALGFAGMAHGALWGRRFGRSPLVLFVAGLGVAATVVSFVIPDNADLQAYLVPLLFALWWGWSRLNPEVVLAPYLTSRWQIPVYLAVAAILIPAVSQSWMSGHEAVRAAALDLSDAWGSALVSGTRTGDLVVIQDVNTEFLLRGLAHSLPGWPGATILNSAQADADWYRSWWQKRQGLPPAEGLPELWTRRIAGDWKAQGGRVFVDFGTPGWLPGELTPAGWLGEWSPPPGAQLSTLEVPRLQVAGGSEDPDWVRTVVWYYYRLGSYYRARGFVTAAVRAWDEGLQWAPAEEALLTAKAELVVAEAGSAVTAVEETRVATP